MQGERGNHFPGKRRGGAAIGYLSCPPKNLFAKSTEYTKNKITSQDLHYAGYSISPDGGKLRIVLESEINALSWS